MSNSIIFFTAAKYVQKDKTFGQSFLETVDNYFFLGGKKAHVIKIKDDQEKVVLSKTKSSKFARACKFISYFTVIIPLVMLTTKAILRATHNFHLIDPKKKLEKGIEITAETISKLEALIPTIRAAAANDDIVWLATGNNLVFKLKGSPNFVFKMAPRTILRGTTHMTPKEISDLRFSNMIKAKEICLVNQLGNLLVPHAKKIEVNAGGHQYTLIVEEALDFNPHDGAQEELYHQYSDELNETARQLATFVAKTGFNDVNWRNIPLLNEEERFLGNRRVALIDLEHMENVANGFIGDPNGSCGLINCFSTDQIDIVINEAKNQGIKISQKFKDAKAKRLIDLEENQAIREFHASRGIATGKEPFNVDLDLLGLDLTEEGIFYSMVEDPIDPDVLRRTPVRITMQTALEEIISALNDRIAERPDDNSAAVNRYIELDLSNDTLKKYISLGVSKDENLSPEEKAKQLWIYRILSAIGHQGHFFAWQPLDRATYMVQG